MEDFFWSHFSSQETKKSKKADISSLNRKKVFCLLLVRNIFFPLQLTKICTETQNRRVFEGHEGDEGSRRVLALLAADGWKPEDGRRTCRRRRRRGTRVGERGNRPEADLPSLDWELVNNCFSRRVEDARCDVLWQSVKVIWKCTACVWIRDVLHCVLISMKKKKSDASYVNKGKKRNYPNQRKRSKQRE